MKGVRNPHVEINGSISTPKENSYCKIMNVLLEGDSKILSPIKKCPDELTNQLKIL